MIDAFPIRLFLGRLPRLRFFCVLVLLIAGTKPLAAEPPFPQPVQVPESLTLAEAVSWALQNNPELASIRQQYGIATAGVVIAQTYPFNPVWEAKVRAAEGPASAGITNRVSNEHKVLLEIEVAGQGGHRRQAALAALSKAEWEIAFQETALAVRLTRSFNAVLYRQEKLRLLEETVRLNEEAFKQISEMVEKGRLRPADYLGARSDLNDTRAQLNPARAALAAAWLDLSLALGSRDKPAKLDGKLDVPSLPWDDKWLLTTALERRADLHGREQAVAEADARLRLEVANRYGNPNIGPAYEYDPTRISLIGAQLALPLPLFNTRRGEIQRSQAERARAALEVQQAELLVRHDVAAGTIRLQEARQGLEFYRNQVLRDARNGVTEMARLFEHGSPGVDLPQVIEFRRKLLKARDGYLDALWEVRQALADLAAAVGDPAIALGTGREAGQAAVHPSR
jgi:cobalt-zinc-cadmium efflux system outer membrane protein